MIEMMDKALSLLGPDAELLAEVMGELGKKHVHLGVLDETYYPVMGEALFHSLCELLGEEKFNPKVREAWERVYGALSGAMVDELYNEKPLIDQ